MTYTMIKASAYTATLFVAALMIGEACFARATDSLSLGAVNADAGAYLGRTVRWGGTIVAVQPELNGSWLEVSERPLNRAGKPVLEGPSRGRFLVRTHHVLDQTLYAPGREITVAGVVRGSMDASVGDEHYALPLIRARSFDLWPRKSRVTRVGVYEYPADYPRFRDHYYGHHRYPYYYPAYGLGHALGYGYWGHGHHLGLRYRRHHGYPHGGYGGLSIGFGFHFSN